MDIKQWTAVIRQRIIDSGISPQDLRIVLDIIDGVTRQAESEAEA